MLIAITGGTGFVGRHLAKRLVSQGHTVRLIARGVDPGAPWMKEHPQVEFVRGSVSSRSTLQEAFSNCDNVAHLAGINHETKHQDFHEVHVRGTELVVDAVHRQDVDHLSLLSFLRARPDDRSGYHDTKWRAEEIVRSSECTSTILKAGVIYGKGDHMVDHLSKILTMLPVFFLVGRRPRKTAPVHVSDVVDLLVGGVNSNRLNNRTVAVTGPEQMYLKEAVWRVADVLDRDPYFVRLPLFLQYANAGLMELLVDEPPASLAQVQILSEGLIEPAPEGVCDAIPEQYQPNRAFTEQRIQQALPDWKRFDATDLRCRMRNVFNVLRRTSARICT